MRRLFLAMALVACKSTIEKNGLIETHTDKARVYLIKLPLESRNDEWFDGGRLEIHKPKRGRAILQFEPSGTLNTVSILAPNSDSGEFQGMEECVEVKHADFNARDGSSIDVTDLSGTFWITYGSCNKGGTYILNLK